MREAKERQGGEGGGGGTVGLQSYSSAGKLHAQWTAYRHCK